MPGLGAALKRRLTRVCERLFYWREMRALQFEVLVS